jgi:hypothetical protein
MHLKDISLNFPNVHVSGKVLYCLLADPLRDANIQKWVTSFPFHVAFKMDYILFHGVYYYVTS